MIENIINSLQPKSINKEFIRIGNKHDSGYLVPAILEEISVCISPGVEGNYSFEQDLVNNNITCYLFDNTVDVTPPTGMIFTKKHLDTFNDEKHITLDNIIESLDNNLLLQMDIEGSEYKVLHHSKLLHKFKVMVIEFHSLERLKDFKPVFDKLLDLFYVVHIHPNNHAPVAYVEGFDIPTVMEFTFIRKDCAILTKEPKTYPHPLDNPNHPYRFDIILPEVWR